MKHQCMTKQDVVDYILVNDQCKAAKDWIVKHAGMKRLNKV